MADDAPLASLVNKTFDDDIPLAALAAAAPPKAPKAGAKSGKAKAPGAKAAGKAPAAAAAGKAKAKAAKPPKKPDESSSSDSSSDSSDDSSSEATKGQPKKRRTATKGQRLRSIGLKKKRTVSTAELDGDEAQEDVEDTADYQVKKRTRSTKHEVVAELLCRWWYAMEDWPPTDPEFYKDRLSKEKLREVSIEEWEWVEDKDSNGFRKVYMLSQFRGVFRDSTEKLWDLRPKESCPCLVNFMKKDMAELYELLVKAYEEQLRQLQDSKYNEERLKKEVATKITRHKNNLRQAQGMKGK